MHLNEIIKNQIEASSLKADKILKMAYGIKYFDFSPYDDGRYTREDVQWWEQNRQDYVDRLEYEQQVQAQLKQAEKEDEKIESVACDCGHHSYHPMSTLNGSSCPDCYDDMSE